MARTAETAAVLKEFHSGDLAGSDAGTIWKRSTIAGHAEYVVAHVRGREAAVRIVVETSGMVRKWIVQTIARFEPQSWGPSAAGDRKSVV